MVKPSVACGFLLGDMQGEDKRLLIPYNLRNFHRDSTKKFFIDERTFLDIERHAKERKANIIGVFTSYFQEKDESPLSLVECMKSNANPWYSHLFIPLKKDGTIGVIYNYRFDNQEPIIEEIDLKNWSYNNG